MKELYKNSTKNIILPEKLEIPRIDDKRLLAFYDILKPIVTIDNIKYLLREFSLSEFRNQSYIWNSNKDKRTSIKPDSLEIVEDFLCLHQDYSTKDPIFKPTLAEVLGQLPFKTIKEADYFEIIEYPKTNADRAKYEEVYNKRLVLSKVRSYKHK